jgi:hypothetical protein
MLLQQPSSAEPRSYLSKKDASPVRVTDISKTHRPVAAPEWWLQQLGFTRTPLETLKKKHVIAVPPGENGWLWQLEDFLRRQKGAVTGLLQRQ